LSDRREQRELTLDEPIDDNTALTPVAEVADSIRSPIGDTRVAGSSSIESDIVS
jgi:hypothetical protein